MLSITSFGTLLITSNFISYTIYIEYCIENKFCILANAQPWLCVVGLRWMNSLLNQIVIK